jgi:ABC-type multidrug transport system ATPase subunit
VSRVHAKIIADTNGFYLIDNNSTNGVVVNGKRISGKHYLHEKDIILITNTELVFANGRLTWRVFRGGIRVEAEGITKTVGKSKKVICDKVSFSIEPCELVAIIGGSGAGKSTVMNCISGYSQPTSGIVRVNNYDLYSNFEAFKYLIGFVPQQDIVFENLTVHDMLIYAAQLRLPTDTNATERLAIVDQVIDTVGLTDRRSALIKQLSGGQKKRASIAVELLSNPRLFFLDEPTSGLDPGIERELIVTLRSMVESGKTVIFVTHSTLNLHLCDKVIVMGAGGKLCFCGGYEDFLEFFEVSDIVDVYNLINDDSGYWENKYSQTRRDDPIANPIANTVVAKHRVRHDTIRQTLILTQRNLHVLLNDRVRSIMLILQAPLLVWLISVVADGTQFEQYEMTKSLLFALSCSAFWVGLLNSIQEICKERNILRREYMTGLRLDAYVLAKSIAMGLICVIQSFLLTTGFALLIGLPKEGIVGSSVYLEILLVTFLTALAATSTGILVSAMFRNADRAMAIAPVLLIPQLLFSGLIFTLEGPSKIISWVAACRFSMEAYGSIANLNTLALRIEEQGIIVPHNAEAFYEYTVEHFCFAIGVLLIFIPVYCIMAGLVLRNIKKSQD